MNELAESVKEFATFLKKAFEEERLSVKQRLKDIEAIAEDVGRYWLAAAKGDEGAQRLLASCRRQLRLILVRVSAAKARRVTQVFNRSVSLGRALLKEGIDIAL